MANTQHCPFCGADETDRFDLEGHRFLVFRCMFTPEVDPTLDEAGLAAHLARDYPPERARGLFRGTCDRLHLFVTKGPGGRALTAGAAGGPEPPAGD